MDREPHDLSWWRGRILHSALVAVAVLGTVAYIPSVVLAFRFELWSIVAIDTLALAGAYVLLFAKRPSYESRAIGASAIIYLLAVVLIAVLGMTGAGLVWLAAFPLFTAILLGLRPAVVSIGLSTATCTVFGVLLAMGRWHWAAFQTPLADELATWVVDAANTLVVS